MPKAKKLSYETAMDELRQIVNELQEEAVSVDDLSAKVRRAAELLKFCQEKLRSTEEELGGLFEEV